MVITQSYHLLVCSCCCQCCRLTLLQTVCSKVRLAHELASQFYSDVKGSNPILRQKHNDIDNNFAKTST